VLLLTIMMKLRMTRIVMMFTLLYGDCDVAGDYVLLLLLLLLKMMVTITRMTLKGTHDNVAADDQNGVDDGSAAADNCGDIDDDDTNHDDDVSDDVGDEGGIVV
jgi:hypothetical protein